MGNDLSLRLGREFEVEIFGNWLSDHSKFYADNRIPEYLDFESSIAQQIEINWKRAELSRELGQEFYDPSKPRTGKSLRVWSAVKNYLSSCNPKYRRLPLHLYVSVGWNALDYYHGVDAFFWWEGVYASVDLSLKRKESTSADLQLTREDLQSPYLGEFGRNVGEYLIARRLSHERYTTG